MINPYNPRISTPISSEEAHIQYLENTIIPDLKTQLKDSQDSTAEYGTSARRLKKEKDRLLAQIEAMEASQEASAMEAQTKIDELKRSIIRLRGDKQGLKADIEYFKEENQRNGEVKTALHIKNIEAAALKARLKNIEHALATAQEQAALSSKTEENEDIVPQVLEGEVLLDEEDTSSEISFPDTHPPHITLEEELEDAEAGFRFQSDKSEQQCRIEYLIKHADTIPAHLSRELLNDLQEDIDEGYATQCDSPPPSWHDLFPMSPEEEVQDIILLPSRVSSTKSVTSVRYIPCHLEQYFSEYNQTVSLAHKVTLKKTSSTQGHTTYSLVTEQNELYNPPHVFFREQSTAQVIAHICIEFAYHHYANKKQNEATISEQEAALSMIIHKEHPLAQEVINYLYAYQRLSHAVVPLFVIAEIPTPPEPNMERVEQLSNQLLPWWNEDKTIHSHSVKSLPLYSH